MKEVKIDEAAGNVRIEKLREWFPNRFTPEIKDKLPSKAGKDQAKVKYTSSVTKGSIDPSYNLKVIDLKEGKNEISYPPENCEEIKIYCFFRTPQEM